MNTQLISGQNERKGKYKDRCIECISMFDYKMREMYYETVCYEVYKD